MSNKENGLYFLRTKANPAVYEKILLPIIYFTHHPFVIAGKGTVDQNFNDGDFTNNPTWIGNTADWVVNSVNKLQSNNTTANSTFYLATTNNKVVSTQWEMYVELAFNTSSTNYVDVYLNASSSDLVSNTTSGYFVRIGGTDDEVALFKKSATGVITKIIDGANATLTSNNTLKVKVICNATYGWSLFRDATGTGGNYILEGTVTDASYTSSSYFGFLVKQSTSSFFQKHFFDDITIQTYSPDVTPPAIQAVTAVSSTAVDVTFSEPVDASAETTGNYLVSNNVGNPTSAVRDPNNLAVVHLTFATPFQSGVTHTISINNVKDFAGNAQVNGAGTFSFYVPKQFDVVIDEIFADPTPQVALPNAEYIEIKNSIGRSINLEGWKLSTTSSTSGLFPSFILPADSFLIITNSSSAALFTSYGRVLGIASFPALDNAGTTLTLKSKEGATIHSVSYNVSWFQNDVKSNGGWSLEMIDTKNPCSGASNWKASTDQRGGTPARINSVNGVNVDNGSPSLLRAAALDSVTLELTFSEPVDSLKASLIINYAISGGSNTIRTVNVIAPAFNKVQMKLAAALQRNIVYTITVNNITDCSGNIIQALNAAKFGLTSQIDNLDVVINEILFNPKPDGVDYVEIYNRSSKIFDLKDIYIANRSSSTNALGSLQQLTTESIQFFPGDYYVISSDAAIVRQTFTVKNPDNFIDVSMPSFPDDKGVVVLLNGQGVIVDELRYDAKWHFALIDNDEGIALERIDFNKPTQSKDNWHSAASTVGFGTPSYQNSQYRVDIAVAGEATATPKTFSPDNDGFEDYTTFSLQGVEPGFVANITIFDALGRPVRALAKNATLTTTNTFRWDGLNDKFIKVPVGAYLIYTEMFNLDGKKKSFKTAVVVASRFQ